MQGGMFCLFLLLVVVSAATAAAAAEDHAATLNASSSMPLGNSKLLPIVYVFTVSGKQCQIGLPEYIRYSLIQAQMTQRNADVILASNYGECPRVRDSVNELNAANKHNNNNDTSVIQQIIQIDTGLIASNRTKVFLNASENIFQGDNALWISSALRFFHLEDLMIAYKYQEMVHVEADNLLYGSFSDSLLPLLRSNYKKLAATPLNANKTFITASVLWIANLAALVLFNDYLLALASNTEETGKRWNGYIDWLRPYACCKHGGVAQDANGMGLKPYAINEMSMLAYYHELQAKEFEIFPVVPVFKYMHNRHVVNASEFGPGGKEVGAGTGIGVWDPNSWGQFLGGTHSKNGRDRGFSDASHIAGQVIRTSGCRPHVLCGGKEMHSLPAPVERQVKVNGTTTVQILACYTAPFVRCGSEESGQSAWTPLWNLHVHSKHTQNFISTPCACALDGQPSLLEEK